MFIRIVLLINSIEYKEALNEAFDCTKAAQYSAVISANHAKDYAKYMVNQIASLTLADTVHVIWTAETK